MTSRTKKAAAKKAAVVDDTVTFKKTELVDKLKAFLENENACDGDWLNKVRVEFLGEKIRTVSVRLKVVADIQLDMPINGKPSKEEIAELIRNQTDSGEICIVDHCDESDFEVDSVEVMDA